MTWGMPAPFNAPAARHARSRTSSTAAIILSQEKSFKITPLIRSSPVSSRWQCEGLFPFHTGHAVIATIPFLGGNLGGEVQRLARVVFQEPAQDLLAAAAAAGPGRVEEVAAQRDGLLESCLRLGLIRAGPARQSPQAVADLTHRPAHPAKGAVDHRSLPFMVSGFVECSLPMKVGGDHDPVAVRGSAGNESCMNQPALLQSPSRESRLGSVRRKRNELRYYRVTEWGGLFREIPAMSDQDQEAYDLADVPEPRQPKAPVMPGQPLPRPWKTEPDEDEEEELKEAAEAKKKQEAAQSAKETVRSAEVRQRARKAKPKESKKSPWDEGSERKVLVEETPALDTYEARQRGRLIVGALVASCFGIFGWIFYNLFICDPNAMEIREDEPPPPVTLAPALKKDL